MKTRRRTKGSCGLRKKLGEGESTGTVRGESAMLTRSRSVAARTCSRMVRAQKQDSTAAGTAAANRSNHQ